MLQWSKYKFGTGELNKLGDHQRSPRLLWPGLINQLSVTYGKKTGCSSSANEVKCAFPRNLTVWGPERLAWHFLGLRNCVALLLRLDACTRLPSVATRPLVSAGARLCASVDVVDGQQSPGMCRVIGVSASCCRLGPPTKRRYRRQPARAFSDGLWRHRELAFR